MRRLIKGLRGRSSAPGPAVPTGPEAPLPGAPEPRVVFYTRPGCHLCDEARLVLAAVCAEEGEEFDEISIDGVADLEERFGHEVPVTVVDGRQHDFWRVDPERLRRALRDS